MKYLYYTLYRHLLKVKTNETPAWNAMLLISILEYTNILSVDLYFNYNPLDQFKIENQLILEAFIPGLILYFINYFILVKNAPKLSEKYKDESDRDQLKGTVMLILYALLSVLIIYLFSPK